MKVYEKEKIYNINRKVTDIISTLNKYVISYASKYITQKSINLNVG